MVVLAESRGREANRGFLIGEFDLVSGHGDFSGDRMVNIDEHLARFGNMRILCDAIDGINRCGGNTGFQQALDDAVNRQRARPGLNNRFQFCMMSDAIDIGAELFIFQRRNIERLFQQAIEFVVAAGDDDVAILRFEGVIGVDG